jgi:hypothetical protein
MSKQWEVERPAGCCSVTGRKLEEGEEFHTALVEEGESFRRLDISLDAWQGPPDNAFCHFKTRMPTRTKRKKLLVNDELLVQFFQRLAAETEPIRVQFRYVLALILMRKRLLRYDGSGRADGREVWKLTLTRDRSVHQVVNPQLTDDQIGDVSRELGVILHTDMGEFATEAEAGEGNDPESRPDPGTSAAPAGDSAPADLDDSDTREG